MPSKRSYRKRNPARKTGRRRYKKRGQRTTTVNRGLQPFAARHIVKMKYATSFRMTTAALTAQYVFNTNSIFDPDSTSVGHQPYSHDTWATIYNRYRVIGVSYYITAYAAVNKTATFCILPSNGTTSVTSIDQAREEPRARSGTLSPITAGNPQRFKGKIYNPALTGRTRSQYMADDRYQALFGTSPSEQLILNLFAENPDGTLVPDCYVQITLNYMVELFDPKILGQS